MKITPKKYCNNLAVRIKKIFLFNSEAIHKNKNCISNCIQTSAENNSFDIL